MSIKIIEIQKRVYANNDAKAEVLRNELKSNQTFMINLMSSPGSGKTTFVVSTINLLKEELNIGVIEADIDSDVDAITVQKSGARVMQLHSGGMCHIDAGMTSEGLEALDYEDLDFVILENIGNLICPASYDLGQAKNVMILSVPEGHDKPLKYPKMFTKVDALIISKVDTVSLFDFDFEKVTEYAKSLNPEINIFPLSAKTGEGMDAWIKYIKNEIMGWRT
ncbi:Hydrogenase isoenzymes nickel incorporation protein HypB [Candidatus Izimaplasma bacterium HR1]|jgi:hydrogenase nickel incorporation protein HypB|uniref:hydrogenase nickel incorporation protein HypB n=1 Tax=Candidatus Izimoplasma sp. HR1 TaxID=1541959 RepID=UPI0004F6DA77|nr:Hydrogenase isoenzymes nickel incorporation protein HypB [Candidatus Izimaplasma bacterium HR1]